MYASYCKLELAQAAEAVAAPDVTPGVTSGAILQQQVLLLR